MNRKVSPMNRNGNNQETMNQLRERYKRIRCKFDAGVRFAESSREFEIEYDCISHDANQNCKGLGPL